MICIDEATYQQAMRVIRASHHQEARSAANRMRLAAIESATRESEFNNEVPALLMRQAG
jgi:hypothetical protein